MIGYIWSLGFKYCTRCLPLTLWRCNWIDGWMIEQTDEFSHAILSLGLLTVHLSGECPATFLFYEDRGGKHIVTLDQRHAQMHTNAMMEQCISMLFIRVYCV